MKAFKNNILIWIAGGDEDALVNVAKSETSKFVKLGLVILIPGLLGWLGMWFACPYIGIKAIVAKLFLSTTWSFIILSLDIFLVSTLDKRVYSRSKWNYFGLIVSRILLSIFIGLVMSHPLVLKIFEGNINEQINAIKWDGIKEIKDHSRKHADSLCAKYQFEVDRDKVTLKCLSKLKIAELAGKAITLDCGSTRGKPGHGSSAKGLEDNIKKLQDSISLNTNKIDQTKHNVEIDVIEAIKNYKQTFSDDYLKRMTALDMLKKNDLKRGESMSHTRLVSIILCLFLIVLDSVAILVKVINPIGKYEDSLTEHELYLERKRDKNYRMQESLDDRAANLKMKYRIDLINAVYSRSAFHSPEAIQQTVNAILASENSSTLVGTQPQDWRQFFFKLLFLLGSTFFGVLGWYWANKLGYTPDHIAIGISLYIYVTTGAAIILKFQ